MSAEAEVIKSFRRPGPEVHRSGVAREVPKGLEEGAAAKLSA